MAKLFEPVDVFDGQESEIHVVVEGFSVDHFFTAEFTVFQGCAAASVQRPLGVSLEMLYDITKESS